MASAFPLMAPLERTPLPELRRQRDIVTASESVRRLLEDLPMVALVVNGRRQIVYGNAAAAALLGLSMDAALGLRFGEAARCEHSDDTPCGCGTTEFCVECGAARALYATAATGAPAQQECRIRSKGVGRDLDLRVWTRRFTIDADTFTLVLLLDIAHEKRRRALERAFFHDVLNTAGNVSGLTTLLADTVTADRSACGELLTTLQEQAQHLIEEIEAHRDLLAGECGNLAVRAEMFSCRQLVESIAEAGRAAAASVSRQVVVSAPVDVAMLSDARLVRRVLTNMVQNALEACPRGGTVTISAAPDRAGDRVRFAVHNPGAMPLDVQRQIFQRSFSTKGPGRGTGTYSMKLLTEGYLGGILTFTSTGEEGTTFVAEYPRRR